MVRRYPTWTSETVEVIMLMQKIIFSVLLRRSLRSTEIIRRGHMHRNKSEEMSAAAGITWLSGKVKENNSSHSLITWQTATCVLSLHCGLGSFIHDGPSGSHTQKSWLIKKMAQTLKTTTAMRRCRWRDGRGSMRRMVRRIAIRADHIIA